MKPAQGFAGKRQDGNTTCLNSGRHARIAAKPCHPTRAKPESAPMSARFALPAWTRSWTMSAPIAAAGLCRGRSGPRPIGRGTISSATTRRALRFGTGRSIEPRMRASRHRSRAFHPRSANTRGVAPRQQRPNWMMPGWRMFNRNKFRNVGPVDGTLLADILFGDRRGSAEGWRINASAAELGETYDET